MNIPNKIIEATLTGDSKIRYRTNSDYTIKYIKLPIWLIDLFEKEKQNSFIEGQKESIKSILRDME